MDSNTTPRRLVIFNFDGTLIESGAEHMLLTYLPPEQRPRHDKAMYQKFGNRLFVNEMLYRLHVNCGLQPQNIRAIAERLEPIPYMIDCIRKLHCYKCDLIIISDSNELLIRQWLDSHCVLGCFKQVISNPAQFQNGILITKPYHEHSDCKCCPINLCKRAALDEFLKQIRKQKHEYYYQLICVSACEGDMCLMGTLREKDIACVREGTALAEKSEAFRARVLNWTNGLDLFDSFKTEFCRLSCH